MSAESLGDVLVSQGYATHRRLRRIIREKHVTVNGVRAESCSVPFVRGKDTLAIGGTPVPTPEHICLMLNKAQGTVCSFARGSHVLAMDCVPQELREPPALPRLHMAGRLDYDTEGLLLLTTDGKLSHRLTGPGFHIEKTYLVCLRNECAQSEREAYRERLAEGIEIPPFRNERGFTSSPARIEWTDEADPYCTLSAGDGSPLPALCRLTLTEGKFHQVKRMFWALGNEVVYLKRIATGSVMLDPALLPGAWRHLTKDEAHGLRNDAWRQS